MKAVFGRIKQIFPYTAGGSSTATNRIKVVLPIGSIVGADFACGKSFRMVAEHKIEHGRARMARTEDHNQVGARDCFNWSHIGFPIRITLSAGSLALIFGQAAREGSVWPPIAAGFLVNPISIRGNHR